MVLNYCTTNYIGWPLPAFIIMMQRYEKYPNYATISAKKIIKSC